MNIEQLVLEPKQHLRGDDGSRVLSVRMKEDLIAKIDKIAEETDRSRNELISIFVSYAIANCVIKK